MKEEIGNNGFGYDCIFYANEYNASIASLSDEKKDEISHRGKALRELQEQLIVFCQK